MRVVLAGATGQLGRELVRSVPPEVDLAAFDRLALDITDAERVDAVIGGVAPAVVINAAAFTAVDRAESEESAAQRVNRDGVSHLAEACRKVGCRMIHVSTDFVFDGEAEGSYRPEAPTAPRSAYGRTKLAGEEALLDALGGAAVIVRTSRVYSSFGHNFVTMMLGLMRQRDTVQVVDDQVGSPTWAALLAHTLWEVAEGDLSGTYHWCDGGSCTWHGFAEAIQVEALERGLLDHRATLEPVGTDGFPSPASRPANSVLDSSLLCDRLGVEPTPWRLALGRMLDEMAGIEVANA